MTGKKVMLIRWLCALFLLLAISFPITWLIHSKYIQAICFVALFTVFYFSILPSGKNQIVDELALYIPSVIGIVIETLTPLSRCIKSALFIGLLLLSLWFVERWKMK